MFTIYICFRLNWLNLAASDCQANYVNLISVCMHLWSRPVTFLLLRPCVAFFHVCVCECMFLSHLMCLKVYANAFVCVVQSGEQKKIFHSWELFVFRSHVENGMYPSRNFRIKTQNLPYAIKCAKEFSAIALPCNAIWHSTQLHVSLRRRKPFSFFFRAVISSFLLSRAPSLSLPLHPYFLRTENC